MLALNLHPQTMLLLFMTTSGFAVITNDRHICRSITSWNFTVFYAKINVNKIFDIMGKLANCFYKVNQSKNDGR